jgi:Domain of unknown function (DUF222)
MAEQAGHGNGQGGAPPSPGPRLPGGTPGRDPHLPGFAKGGAWDACPPSAALAAALEAASGPQWRCAGASRQEMLGLLRQWQALESRAAAAKLAVLRALIRDDEQPLPGGACHGDLPLGWTRSLAHDVALALSMPAVSAERLMWLAWDLEGRLPGIGGLLAAGVLTTGKAQGVSEALAPLPGQDAAATSVDLRPPGGATAALGPEEAFAGKVTALRRSSQAITYTRTGRPTRGSGGPFRADPVPQGQDRLPMIVLWWPVFTIGWPLLRRYRPNRSRPM